MGRTIFQCKMSNKESLMQFVTQKKHFKQSPKPPGLYKPNTSIKGISYFFQSLTAFEEKHQKISASRHLKSILRVNSVSLPVKLRNSS